MHARGKINPTSTILTILGFAVVIGGSFLARYAIDEPVAIIAGILASIGIGLLAFARYFQ